MALDQQTGTDTDAATEAFVADVLRAVSALSERPSVRKTTLAALLTAVEEESVSQEISAEFVTLVARTNLADALLGLRERGLVQLTDSGFSLSEIAAMPTPQPAAWLTSLVGKKMVEWQLVPSLA